MSSKLNEGANLKQKQQKNPAIFLMQRVKNFSYCIIFVMPRGQTKNGLSKIDETTQK